MIKYAFKNRTDAEALLALLPTANRPNSQRVRFGPRLTTGWLFFTPPGGIPAAGEELCGEAECTPYFIDENFNKKEILDDGAPRTSNCTLICTILSRLAPGTLNIKGLGIATYSALPTVAARYCQS